MRRDKQSTNFVKKSRQRQLKTHKKKRGRGENVRDKLIYNSPESRIAISNTHTYIPYIHTPRGNQVQCKYPAVFSLLLIFVNDSAVSPSPSLSVSVSDCLLCH